MHCLPAVRAPQCVSGAVAAAVAVAAAQQTLQQWHLCGCCMQRSSWALGRAP